MKISEENLRQGHSSLILNLFIEQCYTGMLNIAGLSRWCDRKQKHKSSGPELYRHRIF